MKWALLPIVLLASGCVAPSETLVNSAGQTMRCSSFGFGVIGVPIALGTYAHCLERAREAGYRVAGGDHPPPEAIAPTSGPPVPTRPSPTELSGLPPK